MNTATWKKIRIKANLHFFSSLYVGIYTAAKTVALLSHSHCGSTSVWLFGLVLGYVTVLPYLFCAFDICCCCFNRL